MIRKCYSIWMKRFLRLIFQLLGRWWPIVVLLLIEAVLVTKNFTTGTYLVGWDNLFAEFNPSLNIERAWYGVWQEYRGLGYEDGMSHLANLPLYILSWLFSFIFSTHIIRYIVMFGLHFLGGVGMYVLIHTLLHKKYKVTHSKSEPKYRSFILKKLYPQLVTRLSSQLPALAGATFYLLNFATIQMFYLPFEPFSFHFGFLPWLILALQQYLETHSKKWLGWLAVLSLLATPQAHVPTVFISFGIILAIFLLFSLLRNPRKQLKPVILALTVLIITNAFWGLPFTFSTLKNSAIISDSKNNQMATPDIFVKNQKYGNLSNTVLLRGFSLEYVQYDHLTQKSDLMMKEWITHIESQPTKTLSWLFFGLAIVGIIAILFQRDPRLYPFVTAFIFTFSVIGNDIPGVEIVSYVLRTYVPLFADIFRFVFTKFFILHAFSFSVLVALSLHIVSYVPPKFFKLLLSLLVSGAFVYGVLLTAKPVFDGYFFHPQLREEIPQEYFQVFEFFNQQPSDERIAILPIPWYWAWTQYNWGVIGSGFQWFGLRQPTLDLAFTPWSQLNENVHWELNQALRASDPIQLEAVIKKYHITWIIVDNNILFPNQSTDLTAKLNVESLLRTSDVVEFEKKFDNIYIYKARNRYPSQQFVSIVSGPKNVGPGYHIIEKDLVAKNNLISVFDESQPFDEYYPFRSLFTGKSPKDLEFDVEDLGEVIVFRAQLPASVENYTLVKPPYNQNSLLHYEDDFNTPWGRLYPSIFVDGKLLHSVSPDNSATEAKISLPSGKSGLLEIMIPKTYGLLSYNSEPWNDLEQEMRSCDPYRKGEISHELFTTSRGFPALRMTSKNSSNCIHFSFLDFPVSQSYLVTAKTVNTAGRGFFVSIFDDSSYSLLQDTYLDTAQKNTIQDYHFVIPPALKIGSGFSITFDNLSFNRDTTMNELHSLTLFQIPFEFLSELKLVPSDQQAARKSPVVIPPTQVTHPNPVYYSVKLNTPIQLSDAHLVLWQGNYDGWISITRTSHFPFFQIATPKVLVNNWAMGWNLSTLDTSKPTTIHLFFWPHLITVLGGMLLLSLPFFFTTRLKRKHKRILAHHTSK